MEIKILFVVITVLALISPNAAASSIDGSTPELPNQFHGEVRIDGDLADDGTLVSAVMDDEVVETSSIIDGYYSIIVRDSDGESEDKTVSFYVDGSYAEQTGTFCNGCTDRIDLTVSEHSEENDEDSETDVADTGASTGSGGGGGSGAADGDDANVEDGDEMDDSEETETDTVDDNNEEDEENDAVEDECVEDWVCDDWSECVEGYQTRECTDENECGTDLYEPSTRQPCTIDSEDSEDPVILDTSITGRLVSGMTDPITVLAIILAAGLFSVFYIKYRK